MGDASRSSKKRKASVSTATTNTPESLARNLDKSSDFWIDDGNVILQTSTKEYRVHRGILSMHSSVFRDMFNIPQPTEPLSSEGVPVVGITDSAEDWDLLLPIIYGLKLSVEMTFTA
jgi:hypothetical protein